MKISVIIPTYNRRHTLGRAIQSVMDQSLLPAEIFVVDDGSTDGTSEWIQKSYPSIQLIIQPKQGVSAARNTGINAAEYDWTAFLDSDDEWLPNKLEKQVEALQRNPDIKFCHSEENWIRNGVRVNQKKGHQKYGGYIFEQCLDKCRISPSTLLIHKSIFESVGYFDESFQVCEDYDLWLRITAKYLVLYLKESLVKKYGGHEDQLSNVKEGIEFHHIRVLEKLIESYFSEKQKQSMVNMLIHKLNIYAKGAAKRGRTEDYQQSLKRIDELSSVA